jgi:hypothetical protein
MGDISSTTGLPGFNFYLDPRRDYTSTNWNRSAGFGDISPFPFALLRVQDGAPDVWR